jgi:hypothetical protein
MPVGLASDGDQRRTTQTSQGVRNPKALRGVRPWILSAVVDDSTASLGLRRTACAAASRVVAFADQGREPATPCPSAFTGGDREAAEMSVAPDAASSVVE